MSDNQNLNRDMLIEQRITNEGPKLVLAYLLWAGWLIVDIFLIPPMARAKREVLCQSYTLDFERMEFRNGKHLQA